MKSWNYLGNGIVDRLIKNTTGKQFLRLDRAKINALPEIKYFSNSSLKSKERYLNFYFTKRNPQIILNNSQSIIMLHNSWTPLEYKLMTASEFLKQDIFLSKLLSSILNKIEFCLRKA